MNREDKIRLIRLFDEHGITKMMSKLKKIAPDMTTLMFKFDKHDRNRFQTIFRTKDECPTCGQLECDGHYERSITEEHTTIADIGELHPITEDEVIVPRIKDALDEELKEHEELLDTDLEGS